MMRDTPRIFVGPVTLRLEEPTCRHVADAVRDLDELLPGIRVSELDAEAGTVMVSAERPADRADVVAALGRVGCRVRG